MKSERELASILDREKTELINHIHGEYWNNAFKELFRKHSYQHCFYFVQSSFNQKEVAEYCRKSFSDLCNKFGIEFSEKKVREGIQLNIKICADEISVLICKTEIQLKMVPYFSLIKEFSFIECDLVITILTELLDEIFIQGKDDFDELLAETKHIEKCSKRITSKSIEIARSSIRALYFQKDKSDHASFVQKALYSSFLKDGKVIRIYHKDFFENPEVLTRELED